MTEKRLNNIRKISLLEENSILKQKLKELQECEEQFKKICDDVDGILAEHNRTGYCEVDEECLSDIHISLNDDFGKNTLPIYTDVFTDLNNYFEVIGSLFVSNSSLGDDFRPYLWLCYEGVLDG